MTDRRLVALDVDGTILSEDGEISPAVRGEVRRVAAEGHEVMLATGRSVSMTLPILDRLGLVSEFVVCANGAITLERDLDAPLGYSRLHVETFDPTPVLTTIREHLADASFAVEDAEGLFRFHGRFPDGALAVEAVHVDFDDLMNGEATRVVVLSPDHRTDEFLGVVEKMGLHRVSYNVGWTAWLDIAPDGVTKATGLERVRELLDIPRSHVVAIGDGRNDIDMLQWAAAEGAGVAMGQSPAEVLAAANQLTASGHDDGVARALARIFPA